MKFSMLLLLSVAMITLVSCDASGNEPAPTEPPNNVKPTIVLVHGAWADALSWQRVIPLLEKHGYNVVAVENPMTSLADDIATTKRFIEAQQGPLVVVAHSYGGVVITGATAGNSNVKALVYVSAFAPNQGEPIGALFQKYGPPPAAAALVPDAAGFVWIDRAKFHDVFAQDLPAADAYVMAATQKPIAGSILEASLDNAAWTTIPSWFLVSQDDRVVKPELQRFFAERMKAKTVEIKSSHASYISHPKEVVTLITQAARTVAN